MAGKAIPFHCQSKFKTVACFVGLALYPYSVYLFFINVILFYFYFLFVFLFSFYFLFPSTQGFENKASSILCIYLNYARIVNKAGNKTFGWHTGLKVHIGVLLQKQDQGVDHRDQQTAQRD